MTYKAAPEHWTNTEHWARQYGSYGNAQACILELRARVEALEATSKPSPNSSQIGSSLVERVAGAIGWFDKKINWKPEARSAIREVAAWLREQQDGDLVAATALEQETDR